MKNEELKVHISFHIIQDNARVQVTLYMKRKPQALDTPDDFSEYTIKNFPGYKTQQ